MDDQGEREYRTAELARAAGITVRTLRFYRERKLLPPPRREGRIAWYDHHHLARLRTITALLERGHTLGGITELMNAFEEGQDVGSLLGVTPTEETPVRLSPEELADAFAGEVTTENFAEALKLGYLATDGDEIVHISRRLLDVSVALIREGVPLAAVLEAAHASGSTPRPSPRSSWTRWPPTPPAPTSTASARWPRAWSRRNSPWRWTATSPPCASRGRSRTGTRSEGARSPADARRPHP